MQALFAHSKNLLYLCSVKEWKAYMKRYLTAGFLLLFCAYYANVTLFSHSHIVNGTILVHSHMHSQHHHDSENGGHTVLDITLIANLANQFLTTGDAPLAELQAYNILLLTLDAVQDAQAVSLVLSCPSLRAPPALCSTPRS